MGQKVNPIGFRLQVRRDWVSRWYSSKEESPAFIEEDERIRAYLHKKLRYASVPRIFIERAGNRVRVKIFTARPGVVIGRKGQELDKLKASLAKFSKREVLVDIHEIKKPDVVAQLVAENVALQLERRISFRRAMKKAVQMGESAGAQGMRIQCCGRLGGAEIARKESQRFGRVPLHTLRENIDYGLAKAFTLYGIIGVKCWICNKQDENTLA